MNDTEMIETSEKKQEMFSPYWFWKGGISDNLVDFLLDEIKDVPTEEGKTFSTELHGYEKNEDARNSDVMLFNPIHWFSGIMFNYAVSSNIQAEWNMEITVPQTFQVSQYGPTQHYTWHSDSDMFRREQIIRKLSVVCLLSDRSEFEGGEFELAGVGQIELNKGDVIVFPSMMQHRVVPVTSGIRKSAVLWILGNRRW